MPFALLEGWLASVNFVNVNAVSSRRSNAASAKGCIIAASVLVTVVVVVKYRNP